MRKISVVCMLTLLSTGGYSQAVSSLPTQIRASETMDKISNLNTGEVLYGIAQPEGKVIGDTYLNINWLRTTLLLYEKGTLLEGYPVRYDIALDELEIKGKNGVKVLRGDKVKSFVMIDSLIHGPQFFINAKEYKNDDGVRLKGFFRVLSDGSKPLFKKTNIKVREADYNVSFDVGSRDSKLLREYEYYTTDGDRLIKLPNSKKKLLIVFGDRAGEIEKFMKINDLNPNQESHLKAMFEHYNQLIQKSQS